MRKVLFLVAIAAFGINASAMIYNCDKFNTSTKTCRLIGWSGNQPTSGKLKLPSSFTHSDGITYTITVVEDHALDNLTDVTEITIPATYKEIGGLSSPNVVNSVTKNFMNCPNLKLYKVEQGSSIVEASDDGILYLKGKKELLNVPAKYETLTGTFLVPEECKNISKDAFAGNSTIKTIGLSRDIEVFDNGGLNRMTNLGKIQLISAKDNDLSLNSGVLIYKKRVVSAPPVGGFITYTIPDGINEISPYAFYDCHLLTSIKIPSSVKKIGENAFGKSGLEALTIPASVEEYGKKMVAECTALENVKFESRLPLVPDRFAENCQKLTSIVSSYPIVKVGEAAFKNCRSLKEFPFRGETVLSEDSSFYNTGLEKVVFEESTIADYFSGENLFAYCRNLTEIDFSKLIMEYVDADLAIGPGYAANCLKLKKIKFGDYTGFWHYNQNDRPTPPAFGYSCVVDTIFISTTGAVVGPQFIYSSSAEKRHYTPKVYATTTKNFGYSPLYNSLPIGRMFNAGNGATVAPVVYLDAYVLTQPSWPDYVDYVIPDATYFIPGGTSSNYHLARERGNKVFEMFKISFTKTIRNNMKIKVSTLKETDVEEWPEISDFVAIFNDESTVYADGNGEMVSPQSYNSVSKVRLSYKVNGTYFLTDYTDSHWTASGITLTENEADWKLTDKRVEFENFMEFEIFSADGKSILKGSGTSVDLTSFSSGIFFLNYHNQDKKSNTIKIKL